MFITIFVTILSVVCIGSGNEENCEAWTPYFNVGSPNDNGGNDIELLETIITNFDGFLCQEPSIISARTVGTQIGYRESGQVVSIDKNVGFKCLKEEQQNGEDCLDYEVKFCCPAVIGTCLGDYWTKWYGIGDLNEDGDVATFPKFKEIDPTGTCTTTSGIEIRLADDTEKPYIAGYDKLELSKDGLVCKNSNEPNSNPGGIPQIYYDSEDGRFKIVGDTQIACKDYKIRFCCPFTADKLLKGLFTGLDETPPEDKNQLPPTEKDDFFERINKILPVDPNEKFIGCLV